MLSAVRAALWTGSLVKELQVRASTSTATTRRVTKSIWLNLFITKVYLRQSTPGLKSATGTSFRILSGREPTIAIPNMEHATEKLKIKSLIYS